MASENIQTSKRKQSLKLKQTVEMTNQRRRSEKENYGDEFYDVKAQILQLSYLMSLIVYLFVKVLGALKL